MLGFGQEADSTESAQVHVAFCLGGYRHLIGAWGPGAFWVLGARNLRVLDRALGSWLEVCWFGFPVLGLCPPHPLAQGSPKPVVSNFFLGGGRFGVG